MRFEFRKHLTTLALGSLLALQAGAQPIEAEKREWIHGRSAHFQVFSDGRAVSAQEVAQDLETLHAALSQLIPAIRQGKLQIQSPLPTYVYLFKDDRSIAPFRQNPQILGYFTQGPEGRYLAILNSHEESRRVTYHEFIHAFLLQNFPAIPSWLNEGMAEFYASLEIKKDEARVGGALVGRMQDLVVLNLVPLSELVTIRDFHSGTASGPENFRRYASAWISVHYLLMGNPQRTRQLSVYLELLRRGAPEDQAFSIAFQCEPSVLGREVRAYLDNILARHGIPICRYDLKDLRVDKAFTSQPMPKDQTLARLGILNLRSMDQEARHAQRLFDEAIRINPECAPAFLGKGLLALRKNDWAQAKAPLMKAADLAPEEGAHQILAGQTLLWGENPESRILQARAYLLKGVRRCPGHFEALEQLLRLFAASDGPLDEVTPIVEAALAQYPARRDIPQRWAELLAGRGRPADAMRLLESIQAQGEDPETGRILEAVRKQIRDEEIAARIDKELPTTQSPQEAIGILEAALAQPCSPQLKARIQVKLDQLHAMTTPAPKDSAPRISPISPGRKPSRKK